MKKIISKIFYSMDLVKIVFFLLFVVFLFLILLTIPEFRFALLNAGILVSFWVAIYQWEINIGEKLEKKEFSLAGDVLRKGYLIDIVSIIFFATLLYLGINQFPDFYKVKFFSEILVVLQFLFFLSILLYSGRLIFMVINMKKLNSN